MLCAPTGFGKTAVVVADALLSQEPTCIVTDNRGLQDQYMELFEACGMVDLRGRSNYDCDLKEGYTCEMGYASRCPKKGSVLCGCSQAEMRSALSSLVVTNYDKWTSARKFGTGMNHFKRVVFDEAHRALPALERAMQVTLHYKEVQETLGLDFPSIHQREDFINWKLWAQQARAEAEDRAQGLRDVVIEGRAEPKVVKEYLRLRNLAKKLATVSTGRPENWVVDEVRNGYQFDPIRAGRYTEAMLFLGLESILMVSATVRPKTMYQLGQTKDSFEFLEYDSDFDPKRNPIYYLPTMRVDARATDLSPLWLKVDQFAGRRQDRKGIIQTVSFARAESVLDTSRFSQQMLINPRGEAPTETIDYFRDCGPGTILVSPSVSEGYDFPGTDCEWQVLLKIPFPDGRSKILKARQEDDKEYSASQAMTKMVQIFGRGMRYTTDQCENIIFDGHLEWFKPRYSHLAPKWFWKFWRTIQVLPPPLPKL